jgi:iron complex outermembrane recepter protein
LRIVARGLADWQRRARNFTGTGLTSAAGYGHARAPVGFGGARQSAVSKRCLRRGTPAMTSIVRSRSLLLGVLAPLLALAPLRAGLCQEQPALAEGSPALQQVVVTAQKRAQNLEDVGTSITAFSGAQLEQLGLRDVTDIANQTPSLQFNQYGETITVYNLRGVSQNDFTDHQEAPVAVYVDDAYVASMGALSGTMYDLERVEVLRGPQGTLFGRNATGGLIHYISNAPRFDQEGNLEVSAGNFGEINSQGVVNVPFSDSVAARLSFATDHHDGYIHNLIGPDVNDQNQYAARLQVLWRPSENGEVTFKLHGLRNANEVEGNYSWGASRPDALGLGEFVPGQPDFFGYTGPGTTDPFVQGLDRKGLFDRTVYGTTEHVTWHFGDVTLASVTDYLHLRKRYGEDSDVSPNPVFNYDVWQSYHQFSQELHLSGESGTLRWIAGLYFLDYTTDDENIIRTSPTGLYLPLYPGADAFYPQPDFSSGALYSLSTRSGAIFTQEEWQFAPRFTAIVGARYSEDRKTYDYRYQAAAEPAPEDFYFQDARRFPNVTAKAELDFKPSEAQLLYASVNRGAKSGGWSAVTGGDVVASPALVPPPSDIAAVLRYDQETLTSYELGSKSTLLGGAARFNADVFYYDYRNYQGFFLVGLAQAVRNIDAKIKGAEFEFAWAPVEGLTTNVGLSALDTRAYDVPMPCGCTFLDRQMPQAPKWSGNASVRYQRGTPVGTFSIETDGKWDSVEYFELINAPVDREPGHLVANARLGYTSLNGHWEAAFDVRNLTDKWYRVYNLDLSATLGSNQSVYAPPRLWSFTVAYRWGG